MGRRQRVKFFANRGGREGIRIEEAFSLLSLSLISPLLRQCFLFNTATGRVHKQKRNLTVLKSFSAAHY